MTAAFAGEVPADAAGLAGITLVNGRTFTVARADGTIGGPSDGTVFEDLRILSRFGFDLCDEEGRPIRREHLDTATPTPFHAVSVSRPAPLRGAEPMEPREVYLHRQWVGRGGRHVIEILNETPEPTIREIVVEIAADFAHLFDVKAGRPPLPDAPLRRTGDGLVLVDEADDRGLTVRVHTRPAPDSMVGPTLRWRLRCPPRGRVHVDIGVEPVVGGDPAGMLFPVGTVPPRPRENPHRVRDLEVVSDDPRWTTVVDRALVDLASLRIFDADDPTRVVVAAGAPWYMTLFGRDSLLTSWMAMPFEPDLVTGVLAALADLQGVRRDPRTEEEPGRILHELRRHGTTGAFATHGRYYGTVDATPLFLLTAAEARRWGHLDDDALAALWPRLARALDWVRTARRRGHRGWVTYSRQTPEGLLNQGWKDSWDGISAADGTLPAAPVALVEVQGYVYASLVGAAELTRAVDRLGLAPRAESGVDEPDPAALTREAEELAARFDEDWWDETTSSYLLGLTADGARLDALATNAGHALWCGLGDPDRAHRHLDRSTEELWTGWGLRTLAPSAGRYNPLSYHNGSVWPHDTALVVAGAARLGRFDVVDRVVDGALAAAMHFGGRPPELFAGLDLEEVPTPVRYPSSCSPQAWSSASVLALLRSTVDLRPPDAGGAPVAARLDGPVRGLGPVRAGGSVHVLGAPVAAGDD